MEFQCSASLSAMGSLLRKLDGLLRITQPGPLKESIWRLLNSLRTRADLMSLSEVHDLSLASSNYLVEERFNAYKLAKIDELLRAEDSTPSLHQLVDCLGTIAIKLEKLSDSSEVNCHSHRASYWMKDARELSYEIEDFVDQFFFIHDDTGLDAAMPSWMDKISGFVTRVEEVRERYDRFKLESVLSDPTNSTVNHHLRALRVQAQSEPFVPIDVEELTNELQELVKWKEDDEDDQQLRVICILGAEGVGKTTLARRLCRHLEEEFDCRAFVQTAKRPDMRMILRSILSQVRPKQTPKSCEVPNLIQDLRKYLQDKRYFIIIDDIWSVSAWDVISCAFPEDNYRSRILTTTTDEDIALACCGYEPEHIFKMKPLNDYQSQKLFVDRAFGSEKGCPPEFRNVITDGIIKRCGGLPLAILCIATLIADQQQQGIAYQLEYMQNFLGRNLRTNATSDEILKQVLSLCYSCLPDCLKTCLLYLGAYPENYYIQKDDLVKQWIAEDFICRTERQDTVEVASSYFDELVRFGLIQAMDTNGKEKGFLYAVHPAVFDFIASKSTEDNFISIIDFSESTVAPTDKVRRLCLHFGSATYATAPSSIGLSQVRSLIVMGLLKCMPSLLEFKLVRVAILHLQVDNDRDTSFPLSGVCRLVLLRYLQVKCNVAVELPDQDQMGRLKHLETLEIHARVAYVPSDFVHFPSLLHLRLGRGRYRRHRRPTLSYLPSPPPKTLPSLDGSSRATRPIPKFGFPPFICMITRPPQWTTLSQNLRYLVFNVIECLYDVNARGRSSAAYESLRQEGMDMEAVGDGAAGGGDGALAPGWFQQQGAKCGCGGGMRGSVEAGAGAWGQPPPPLQGRGMGSQIHRVRASGDKDRLIRDRRVRLSVATSIQFYDLHARLGFDEPSKTIDWLINAACAAIDKLPAPDPAAFAALPWAADAVKAKQQQQGTKSGGSSTSETSKGSVGSQIHRVLLPPDLLPASLDCDSIASTIASFTEHKQSWQQPNAASAAAADCVGIAHAGKGVHVLSTHAFPTAVKFGNAPPPFGLAQHFSFASSIEMPHFSLGHDALAASSAPAGDYSLNFSMSSDFLGALQSNSQSNFSDHHHQQLQRLDAPFLFGHAAAAAHPASEWDSVRNDRISVRFTHFGWGRNETEIVE